MSSDTRGPLIVVLPGAGGGMRGYTDLCERLAALDLNVVAMNPRGAGATTGPLEGLSMHDMAADVGAVVEDFGGPAVLVGHAAGNRVARMLATDRPELVLRLVLLAAGGKVPPSPDVAATFQRVSDESLPEAERLEARRVTLVAPGSALPAGYPPQDNSALAIRTIGAAGRATAVDEWWAGGSARMLVVQGAQDLMAPPRNGHLLAGSYPDRVDVVGIEVAGHLLYLERPEAVVTAIGDYLRREGIL